MTYLDGITLAGRAVDITSTSNRKPTVLKEIINLEGPLFVWGIVSLLGIL